MSKYKPLCGWFLQVVCLYGLIAFLMWVILRPKTPAFSIIGLDILSLTTKMQSQPSIPSAGNASIAFSLEIHNPNKRMNIYYNSTNVTFHCRSISIGTAMVSYFHQSFYETTRINGSINVMNMKRLRAVFRAVSNATEDLEVNLVTVVRYRILGLKTRRRRIDVSGRVPVGSDGQMNKTVKRMMHHTPVRWRVCCRVIPWQTIECTGNIGDRGRLFSVLLINISISHMDVYLSIYHLIAPLVYSEKKQWISLSNHTNALCNLVWIQIRDRILFLLSWCGIQIKKIRFRAC